MRDDRTQDRALTQDAYALGHAEHELERSMRQGEYFGRLTNQVIRSAGIAPGMTVLDAGCGAGDVSLLAARLVEATGRVVGVDRSAEYVMRCAELERTL